MSVETDARKSVAEPSLFDVFGPNVSEQVKKLNQRAAELSMDDMARVMDQTGCAVTSSWEPDGLKVGHAVGLSKHYGYMLDDVQYALPLQINSAVSDAYELAYRSFLDSRGFEEKDCQVLTSFKGVSKLSVADEYAAHIPAFIFREGLSDGVTRLQKTIDQALFSLNSLLDKERLGHPITLKSNNNDPKFEVARTFAFDADVGLSSAARIGNFDRSMVEKNAHVRGTRKHRQARVPQDLADKK